MNPQKDTLKVLLKMNDFEIISVDVILQKKTGEMPSDLYWCSYAPWGITFPLHSDAFYAMLYDPSKEKR